MSRKPSTTSQPAVIIGASTAGLFTAYLLARGGVPVRLFDEADRLGPPARTLIVTSRLSDVLGYVPSQAIVNRTHTVQLLSSHRCISVHLKQPDLIVEREALVRLLAERAKEAGVEIHLGCRFTGLEADRDGLVLHLESSNGGRIEPLRTRTLIGADGVASRVAREAGLDGRATVSLRQARVAMPPWARADTAQVWFDPQGTPYFFWLVPESAEHAVVGLIAEDQRQARESLERFLAAQKLEPLGYQTAQVPFSRADSPLWKGGDGSRILLVGDAAGQVKLTTVGGVVTGLCGAEAAARAVLRGTDYRRELGALRGELRLHLLVRRTLNRFAACDYDELLGMMNHRTKGIAASHSRDEIGRLLLPSLLAQPRLLLLAARPLLRCGARIREGQGRGSESSAG